MIKNITIPYVPLSAEDVSSGIQDNFLSLVQDFTRAAGNNPTGNDLIAMYNYIVAGYSAHQYSRDDCPVTFEPDGIKLTLAFFVNVYPLDLEYGLSATKGTISEKSFHIGEEERQVIVGMDDEVDFELYLKDIQIVWETACYGEDGGVIKRPDYEVSGTKIIYPQRIFQVGWGDVQFECYKHTIDIKAYYEEGDYRDRLGRPITAAEAVETGQVSYINADFSTTVTASYYNLNGKLVSKVLALEIPECVENVLGVCFDQDNPDNNPDNTQDNKGKGTVYYNTCDGETLQVDDPDIGYEPPED